MTFSKKGVGILIVLLLLNCTGVALADTPSVIQGRGTELLTNFSLSGEVYLFEYLPVFNSLRDKFEIYAFVLNMDSKTSDDNLGLHVQLRARDTKLRDYFNSTTWFQEAYAYFRLPVGNLDIGKIYRKVGLFWDGSFFGNVQYFNGLKLNPDYGVEWAGNYHVTHSFGVDFSAQAFSQNDQVEGALPGRDVASDPNAHMQNSVTIRMAPTWSWNNDKSVALGFSGMTGQIDRINGPGFTITQVATDLTLICSKFKIYGEILKQTGEPDDLNHPLSRPGYDDAIYWLSGIQWQATSRLNTYVNVSEADYSGQSAKETEIVPGLSFAIRKNVTVITEYDFWKWVPGQGAETLLDKSYNLVLNVKF